MRYLRRQRREGGLLGGGRGVSSWRVEVNQDHCAKSAAEPVRWRGRLGLARSVNTCSEPLLSGSGEGRRCSPTSSPRPCSDSPLALQNPCFPFVLLPGPCLPVSISTSSSPTLSLHRTFTTSRCVRSERLPASLDTFTEEEQLLRESGASSSLLDIQTLFSSQLHLVRRFAVDVVGPKVREMDEKEMMDPAIIKGLYEQGVRVSSPSLAVPF